MPRRPRLIRYKPAPTLVTHLMGEFLGTFFFVLTISLTIQQTAAVGALAPVAIGFVFCSMVFSFGYISSAVFNPAVAIGLWVLELMDTVKTLLYIVTEVTAAVCAGFIGWFLVGDGNNYKAPAPKTDKAVDIFRSGISEFIYTFGLMSAVLHVACSRQRDNQHYGLGLGVFIAAGVFAIGGISGGAINPSVALGLQLPMCAAVDCRPATYFWLYWAFCIGGAVCASFVFAVMHPVDVDSDTEDEEEVLDEEGISVSKGLINGGDVLDILAATDSSFVDNNKSEDEPTVINVDGIVRGVSPRLNSQVPSAQNLFPDAFIGVSPRRSRSAMSNGHFVFPSSASNANLSDTNNHIGALGSTMKPRPVYAASCSSGNTRKTGGDERSQGLPFVPEGTMIFDHPRSRSYTPGMGVGRSRRVSTALSLRAGAEAAFFSSGAGASRSDVLHVRNSPSQGYALHNHTRSHQGGGIRAPNANQKAHSTSPSRARRRSVIQMYESREPAENQQSRSESGGDDNVFTEQQYREQFLRKQQEIEANKKELVRQHLYVQHLQQQQQRSMASLGGSPALSAHAGHPSVHQSQASTPNGLSVLANEPYLDHEHHQQRPYAFASTVPAEDPVAALSAVTTQPTAEASPAMGENKHGELPLSVPNSSKINANAPFALSLNPPHYLASTLRAGGTTPVVLEDISAYAPKEPKPEMTENTHESANVNGDLDLRSLDT